jgi:hypothetical protein
MRADESCMRFAPPKFRFFINGYEFLTGFGAYERPDVSSCIKSFNTGNKEIEYYLLPEPTHFSVGVSAPAWQIDIFGFCEYTHVDSNE